MNTYCYSCGGKLVNSDCQNCFNNSNALKDFEEENE
jgi:hypothetical protein